MHIEGRGTQPSFGAGEVVTGAVLEAVVSKLSFKNEYLLDEAERVCEAGWFRWVGKDRNAQRTRVCHISK